MLASFARMGGMIAAGTIALDERRTEDGIPGPMKCTDPTHAMRPHGWGTRALGIQ